MAGGGDSHSSSWLFSPPHSFPDTSGAPSAMAPFYHPSSVSEGGCYERHSDLALQGLSLRCRHRAEWRAAIWIFLTVSLSPHTQTTRIRSVLGRLPPGPSVGLILCPCKSQSDRAVGAKKLWTEKGSLHDAAGRAPPVRSSSSVAAVAASCLPAAGYSRWRSHAAERTHGSREEEGRDFGVALATC